MPHVLVAGKLHPAGVELLKSAPGVTCDLADEISEASYAPLIGRADALVIGTQPLTAATVAGARDWRIAPGRAYADYRAMARAEAARPDGIGAVAICTPNHTHAPIAAAFREAGIDVILDKPMTARLAEAETLAALQAKTGLVLGLTYAFAHHAMVRQAQAMVAAGMIGRIRQAHVEYVQEWSAGPADPDGAAVALRRDPARAGRTSATGDIGTHAYHLLKTVSGLDVAELRADFHVCGAPKTPEDTAFVNLRMANGAPGLLWVTQVAPGNHCGLRVRLFGDAGGLEWDQEFPEQPRYAVRGEPERIIHRGRGAGMLPAAERLAHLPRGHGEALTDAWSNLYAELGFAVAARRAGVDLPAGLIQYTSAAEGLAGVRFVDTCADSHEAGGVWLPLART